jgi:hypothetical protein
MKKIVTFFGGFFFFLGASAQQIEIYKQGEFVDVSGTIVGLESTEVAIEQNFTIKNVSGITLNLRVERAKIIVLPETQDRLCWGGGCYDAEVVSAADPYISPGDASIADDATSLLMTTHETHGIDGTAQYRYYLINEDDERLDSVDVLYTSTVSVKENAKIQISVYPNPAVNNVNITVQNETGNLKFTLFNVLGEAIINTKLYEGQNTVAVDKLTNGVYFYTIYKDGAVLETKKLVVKH